MNKLTVTGKQDFMGIEIPVVAGGFGKDKRCMSDKTIAEIHEAKIKHVRELINRNIKRFKEKQDFIDLKVVVQDDHNLLTLLGYTKMQISKAKHIYILSERGYAKLIKIMDSDLAWEIHDRLIDEYFQVREEKAVLMESKVLPPTEVNPQLQMFKALYDNAIAQEIRIKNAEDKIAKLQMYLDSAPVMELQETTQSIDSLFLSPVTLYTTTAIGKAFNISARAVNRYLLAQNIHFPYKRGWKLQAKYAKCDYVYQKTGSFYNSEGEKEDSLMTWWTAEGKDFVCTVLINAGLKKKCQAKPYDRHAYRGKRKKKSKQSRG